MAGAIMDLFGYQELTGIVQKFQYDDRDQIRLSSKVPNREINGDIANWVIEKPDIQIYDYFTGRSGMANPIRLTDWGEKTFSMPYRFTSKNFDFGQLNQLRKPGTLDYMSDPVTDYVDSEVRKMDWRVGSYTDEYLVAQAIQGTLTIKVGTTGASINRTINYEIPSGNQFGNAISWTSTATATPFDDFDQAKQRAAEFGVTLKSFICTQFTANRLARTAEMKDYIIRYNAGARHVETGGLPPVQGLDPMIVDTRYAAQNQTEGFKNKMIADNKVIFIAEWPAAPNDWIEMQQAEFWVPNDMDTGVERSNGGVATWARVSSNPTGMLVYHKVARFPVIRKPWAIVILTVN